jgi:hypothetical protein
MNQTKNLRKEKLNMTNLWKKVVKCAKGAALALAGVVGLSVAVSTPAQAVPITMTEIFAAADVTTLQTNVGTLLIAFIAISLLFVAKRYLSKAGVR